MENNYYQDPENHGENPVIAAVKQTGKSKILFYAITSLVISVGCSLFSLFYTGQMYMLLSLIIPIIKISGLLVFYFSCTSADYSGVKTTGISVFKGCCIAELVLMIVSCAIICIGNILDGGFFDEIKKYMPFQVDSSLPIDEDAFKYVLIGTVIILLIIMIEWYLLIIKNLNKIRNSIRTGKPEIVSNILIALLIIIGILEFMNTFMLFGEIEGIAFIVSFFAGASSGAEYVLLAMWLNAYNKAMKEHWNNM